MRRNESVAIDVGEPLRGSAAAAPAALRSGRQGRHASATAASRTGSHQRIDHQQRVDRRNQVVAVDVQRQSRVVRNLDAHGNHYALAHDLDAVGDHVPVRIVGQHDVQHAVGHVDRAQAGAVADVGWQLLVHRGGEGRVVAVGNREGSVRGAVVEGNPRGKHLVGARGQPEERPMRRVAAGASGAGAQAPWYASVLVLVVQEPAWWKPGPPSSIVSCSGPAGSPVPCTEKV